MCTYVIVSNRERMCVYYFLRTTYTWKNYISTYKHMCVKHHVYVNVGWCPKEMEGVILAGNKEFP